MDNTLAHGKLRRGMVLLGRIELPTSPLPRVRSTTELQQQDPAKSRPGAFVRRRAGRRALLASTGPIVKRSGRMQDAPMSAREDKPDRDERLAAKLRENLRRRKAQARSRNATDSGGESALPKKGPDS